MLVMTPEELVLTGLTDLSKSGIYIIFCKESKKGYIGYTQTKFTKRFSTHKGQLRKNKHGNKPLQNSWNKYGEDSFIFMPIKFIEKTANVLTFLELEEEFINIIPTELCFNIVLEPTKESKITTEAREKMKEAALNNKDENGNIIHSAARKVHYASIKGEGNPMYGKTHTPEVRAKLSKINKNKTVDPKAIEKMAEATRGKKQSPEHIAKRFAARAETLKTKVISEEEHKRRSESHKGQIFTEERKKEYSEKFKGENNPRYGAKLTEETKKLIGSKSVGRGPAISAAKRKNSVKRLLSELIKQEQPSDELLKKVKAKAAQILKVTGWSLSFCLDKNNSSAIQSFII
jgi:group I intron endonuclease